MTHSTSDLESNNFALREHISTMATERSWSVCILPFQRGYEVRTPGVRAHFVPTLQRAIQVAKGENLGNWTEAA